MEKIGVPEDILLKPVTMTENGLAGRRREIAGRAEVKIGLFDLDPERG